MNSKLILTAITLATLSSPSFGKVVHSKSDNESGYGDKSGHPKLSAQLTPIAPSQMGSGEFHFANHSHGAHHKAATSFHGGITLPLGATAYNEDSIARIQNLGITLSNGSGTLNCVLAPESIRFSPSSESPVAPIEADFHLGELTPEGMAPVYSAGNCTTLPSALVSGDTLTITVLSGKNLITTLSGTLK